MTVYKKTFWGFFVVTTFAVIGFFQNCAPVAFTENSVQLASVEVLSCHFNGQEVPSGESVKAYLMSSVPFGEACKEESRRCDNGNLSGSYSFAQCAAGAPASCLFDGRTIAHGESVEAFLNSAVAFGQSCSSEVRRCNNGALSGSYSFVSCSVGSPASCLFNGRTLAHGESVISYLSSSVEYGASCSSEARKCSNGALSGSFNYASCNVDTPKSCLFNGQTIAHGQSVTAYPASSVPYGGTCTPGARTCNNGNLSGSGAFASCSVGSPASCLFNGQTIAHGQAVNAYQASSVPHGSTCNSQARTCNNGILSGTYANASCSVGAPASCTFNNVTVPHGGSIRAYFTNSAVQPDHCVHYEEYRYCTNGILSGSAPYRICDQVNYYWNTYVAVSSPCSGPYNDGRGGIECSSSNEGATAIGSYCGAPQGTVWTCTKVINPLF